MQNLTQIIPTYPTSNALVVYQNSVVRDLSSELTSGYTLRGRYEGSDDNYFRP